MWTFESFFVFFYLQLGVKTLASKLNTSEGAAFQHIQSFYKTFPCVKSFQNRVVADARNLGCATTCSEPPSNFGVGITLPLQISCGFLA